MDKTKDQAEAVAKLPCGVVMLCTDNTGHEIATVTDFERSGYGGFTLKEAQRIRCKRSIARAVIDRYASPVIGENMAEYHRDDLLKRLIDKGWKLHTVYVGYPEDEDA